MIDNTFKTLTAKEWDQLTDAERHAYDDECQRRMDADTRARIKADDHKMKQRARRAARRIGLIARISKSRKLSDDNFGDLGSSILILCGLSPKSQAHMRRFRLGSAKRRVWKFNCFRA